MGERRYTYSASGNPLTIEGGDVNRTLTWDAENRLRRISDSRSGQIHLYTYNHLGERALKRYGKAQAMAVNDKDAGALLDTKDNYSAYVSPYFVGHNGNRYTKHYYAGAMRIASKMGASGSTYAAGTDEPDLYFYHTDHLGSTTYITDRKEVAQYVAYTPYGETFKEYKNVTPYKFNGKELDQETGYYYYGARYYDPGTALWFGTDPLADKYPMNSPYVYCNGNPVLKIDSDGMEPTPAEAVRIAAHVYGDKSDDILIGGWEVSQKKYNLKYNDKTGLNSALYERTVDGVTEYVYATAGTVDLKDWGENIKQPFGLSEQYEHSAYNAGVLSEKLKDKELNFVGHSLGGGEAALNSFVTYGKGPGRRAFTFNAAGVGHITKLKDGGWNVFVGPENNIDAYILITDPLNALQNSKTLMPNVNGKRHYLMPKDWSSTYNGHSIDNILKNFE